MSRRHQQKTDAAGGGKGAASTKKLTGSLAQLASAYAYREEGEESDSGMVDQFGNPITYPSTSPAYAPHSRSPSPMRAQPSHTGKGKQGKGKAPAGKKGAAGRGATVAAAAEEMEVEKDEDFEKFKAELLKKIKVYHVPPQAKEGLEYPREPYKEVPHVSKPAITETVFKGLIKERQSLSNTYNKFKNKLKVLLFRGTPVLTYVPGETPGDIGSYEQLRLDNKKIFWNETALNEMLGNFNKDTNQYEFRDTELINKYVDNHAILWDTCVEDRDGVEVHLLERLLRDSSSTTASDPAIAGAKKKIADLKEGLRKVMDKLTNSPQLVMGEGDPLYLTAIKKGLLKKTGADKASSVLTNIIIALQLYLRAIPATVASAVGTRVSDETAYEAIMAKFRPLANTRVSDAEELDELITNFSLYLIGALSIICIFPDGLGKMIPGFEEIKHTCLQVFGTAYAINNYEEVSLMVGEFIDKLIKESLGVKKIVDKVVHHLYLVKNNVKDIFVELAGLGKGTEKGTEKGTGPGAGATKASSKISSAAQEHVEKKVEVIEHELNKIYDLYDAEMEQAESYFARNRRLEKEQELEEQSMLFALGREARRTRSRSRDKKTDKVKARGGARKTRRIK
jgi:hypothetical protein